MQGWGHGKLKGFPHWESVAALETRTLEPRGGSVKEGISRLKAWVVPLRRKHEADPKSKERLAVLDVAT